MENRILGTLPDLFTKKDGTPVTCAADWPARRKEILDITLPLWYGGMPPVPSVFRLIPLHGTGRGLNNYLIIAGEEGRTVSFELKVQVPEEELLRQPAPEAPGMPPLALTKREMPAKGWPVILSGDGCWSYLTEDVIAEANARGIAVAWFDRTVMAPDVSSYDRSYGVYTIWPELPFGAMSAWAWGYQRAIDALQMLDFIDSDSIAISGHSRGGKTTLLAAAVDERIRWSQINCAGCGGTGNFRFRTDVSVGSPAPQDPHEERLSDMYRSGEARNDIGFWYGPGMRDYIDREQDLPFDAHFMKAAIAPRFYLETNALDDLWANPVGSYLTFREAAKVWKLLEAEDRCHILYRYGRHYHGREEFRELMDMIDCDRMGIPFIRANDPSLEERLMTTARAAGFTDI